MKAGNIPVLQAQGQTLPEAWENSVVLAWQKGCQVKTEYDRSGDPPSRDCTMTVVVEEPLTEPRIHRAFPDSLEGLEVYRLEVVEGIHDDYVGEHGWSYSYHERLFGYPPGIDQIDLLIRKIVEAPHSRRAQAITWFSSWDSIHHEPPCFQRLWCRLLPNKAGNFVFNMNTHWRSRDAFKAAFMNMWAFISLQAYIAGQVAIELGRPVLVGRYTDISDSYHIYGKDWEEFQKFLTTIEKRSFEQRTWATQFAEPFFEEARRKVAKEKEEQ